MNDPQTEYKGKLEIFKNISIPKTITSVVNEWTKVVNASKYTIVCIIHQNSELELSSETSAVDLRLILFNTYAPNSRKLTNLGNIWLCITNNGDLYI